MDRIIAAAAAVLAVVYLYATEQIVSPPFGDPLGPKAYPSLLGVLLLIGAGMLFMETLRRRRAGEPEPERNRHTRRELIPIVVVVGLTLIYFATFETVGYLIGTTVYLLATMTLLEGRVRLLNAVTGVAFAVITYFVFTRYLGVPLPRGAVMPV